MPEPVLPNLNLRLAEATDEVFLQELYASTRRTELEHVPWSAQQKREFLSFQSAAQERHYRQAYPGMERLLIESGGAPVGRLYRYQGALERRVIDIALLAEHTGQGLGTRLLADEIGLAQAAGTPLRLHVEHGNPARRLYERVGFVLTEDQGVYLALEWNPAG
ncbi:N-acetyltransferase family protein [Deinococcus sp. UYEF24]